MLKIMLIFITYGIYLKLLYTVSFSLPSIGEKEPHVLSGHKDWVSCCSVSPDCSMIASVGRFDRVSCPSAENHFSERTTIVADTVLKRKCLSKQSLV